MLAISIINLVLSIFGITVSSMFILFWCGRYFCARFFMRRLPGSRALVYLGTVNNRGVAEHNSVGVSPLVIAYFPTITFHQDTFLPRQDATCAVCLGEYKEEELIRTLPQCGHNFHATCIDAWLQRHATCPVCRMSLQGYFVGRTLSALQPTPPPQPRAASQLTPPTTIDQPIAGVNLRALSEHGHSDASPCGLPSCSPPGEALHHGNPTVLSICSSPSSNRASLSLCHSLQAQTAMLNDAGINAGLAYSVEKLCALS